MSNYYNDDVNGQAPSLANNIVSRIDKYTKESVNYIETNNWVNGSNMDDSKIDGVIYKKFDNKYYRLISKNNEYDIRWWGVSVSNIDNKTQIDDALTTINNLAVNLTTDIRINLLFPHVDDSNGNNTYKTTGEHIVDRKINVIMNAVVEDININPHICFNIGKSGFVNENMSHKINIQRVSERIEWENSNDIGVRFINEWNSKNVIKRCIGFSINIELVGSGNYGVAYNQFDLGYIINGCVGLNMRSENGGFTNENLFIGGEFNIYNSGIGKKRTAIKIDGGNSNKFYAQSFENYITKSGEKVRIFEMIDSVSNIATDFRAECSDGQTNECIVAEEIRDSKNNIYTTAYFDTPFYKLLGKTSSLLKINRNSHLTGTLFFDSGNILNNCWLANGDLMSKDFLYSNISSGVLTDTQSNVGVINDGEKYIGCYNAPTIVLDVSQCKKIGILMHTKDDDAYLSLKMYDSNNQEITNLANTDIGLLGPNYGGCVYTPAPPINNGYRTIPVSFSDQVKKVQLIFSSTALERVMLYTYEEHYFPKILNRNENPVSNNVSLTRINNQNYTIKLKDYIVEILNLSSDKNITLPNTTTSKFKKYKIGFPIYNNTGFGIKVLRNDGYEVANLKNGYIEVYCDGSGWYIINDSRPATNSTAGLVKKVLSQNNSTATDISTLVADFNALLLKMKNAGLMD